MNDRWIRSLPFILIFPGYFFYHWAVLSEWSPAIIGGYINEISAMVCMGFILFGMTTWQKTKSIQISLLDQIFLIFIAWFSLVIVFHAGIQTAPGVVKNHSASIAQITGAYIALRIFPMQRTSVMCLFTTCIFTVLILHAAQSDLLSLLLSSSDEKSSATYQGLARAYLLTSAVGILGVKKWPLRAAYAAAITISLFLIGARSEIIGALILLIVFEILNSRKPSLALLWTMSFAAFGALFIALSIDLLLDLFPENRLMLLIIEGAADESLVERRIYNEMAWQAVLNNPLFGDFGHYEKAASAGAYAHNWISAWVDLGIIGLILLSALLFSSGVAAMKIYRVSKATSTPAHRASISMAISIFVMILIFSLFAKHFTDPGIAMAAGLIGSLAAADSKSAANK